MQVVVETNQTICKVCQQLKNRTLIGRFDRNNKKYIDEFGKYWSGLVCPPCHKERIRQNMKRLRESRNVKVTTNS